jgi:peptidoglycan/xylan/chitin deacetylase (PgdA/CDA1 family)
MMVSLATLERQLDWIGRRYDFVDLDTAARVEEGEPRRGRPVAAVTFDDGYRDVVRLALPLLQRKGIPAALFVVTDRVGVDGLHRHDELYWLIRRWVAERGSASLKDAIERAGFARALARGVEGAASSQIGAKERLLRRLPRQELRRLIDALQTIGTPPREVLDDLRTADWDELMAAKRAGHLIGSHTRTHCILPQEGAAYRDAELRDSRRVLEDRLGGEIVHLSYPDGRFSRATLAAAAAAGYRYAYTTCADRSANFPLLTVPRRTLWEGSTAGARGGFSPSVGAWVLAGVLESFGRGCGGHADEPEETAWRSPASPREARG